MAETTHISWCDSTFNCWVGCQKTGSLACEHCYAESMNLRYAPKGSVEAPNWGPHAPRRRTSAANWKQPLKWEREQAEAYRAWTENGHVPPEPTRFVFCASLADVFDSAVPHEWRHDLFKLIKETPHLTWLLLTKRPQNILKLFEEAARVHPTGIRQTSSLPPLSLIWPRNAAIGFTAVTQAEMDRDSKHALAAFRAVHASFLFWSGEPLMEHVEIAAELLALGPRFWAITGGETDQGKHKARPSHPQWFRDVRDQCAPASVPYHHKQNGEWVSVSEVEGFRGNIIHEFPDGACVRRVGKVKAGRTLDGVTHDARPAF